MGSFTEDTETRLMEAAMPSIKKLCVGRWYNLEYQDRVMEACLIFIEDLRTLSLNSGRFLQDYRADLEVRMGEINRRTPSMKRGRFSLDTMTSAKTGEEYDGYRFISSPRSDFGIVFVNAFLEFLPTQSRQILELLLEGFSAGDVTDELDIGTTELEQEMEELRWRYRIWNEDE